MSARPRDVYEGAASFSLRNVIATAEAPLPPKPASGQLKFKLDGIGQVTAPASQPSTPRFPTALSMRFAASLPAPEPTAVPQPFAPVGTIPNLSFTSMQSQKPTTLLSSRAVAAAKQEHADAKADIMRLTAYVDELTARLKKSQQKLMDTESQLHRTSHALATERQTSESQSTSHRHSLSQAHEIEAKLRAELANRPKRSALTESHFMQSVGSVLQDEQREHAASEKLLELETKVRAMGDAKVLIESEIGALKDLKTKAQKELDDIRSKAEEIKQLKETTESAMSEKLVLLQARCKTAQEGAVAAVKAMEGTEAEHKELSQKLSMAQTTESELLSAISALNAAKIDAESECASSKKQLQAMMVEHGDVSGKVAIVKGKLEELRKQEAVAQEVLTSARTKMSMAVNAQQDSTDIEKSTEIAKIELAGYEAKISQMRAEIAAAEKSALEASALEAKVAMTKSALEGCEAKLAQVHARLGESESELGKRDQRLKDIDAQVEQREALCKVPLFQLDTAANVTRELAAATGTFVAAANEPLSTENDTVGESPAEPPTQMTVIGAQAPSKELCTAPSSSIAGLIACVRVSQGVSALVSMDAPVELTLQRVNFLGERHAMFLDVNATPEAEDPTAKMVNAVVGDLKTKLLEISEQQPVWRAVAPLA